MRSKGVGEVEEETYQKDKVVGHETSERRLSVPCRSSLGGGLTRRRLRKTCSKTPGSLGPGDAMDSGSILWIFKGELPPGGFLVECAHPWGAHRAGVRPPSLVQGQDCLR